MLLKAPTFKIPPDNPFQNDVLGRKESAEILTQILSSINEPFVLALDASWGNGKTTFLNMWMKYLQNDNYQVVYFNAWENDINDDPLSALISEIRKVIETSCNKKKSTVIYSRLKKIGSELVKRTVPLAIKIGTAGVVDTNDLLEKTIAEAAEKMAVDGIKGYEKKQENVKKFKTELENFAKSLKSKGNKPLIFMIDELDRCRPNFAIETLEKAKHFFNVDNIVFVVSIDKKELGNSIKAIYGNDFDATGYLKRFFDLTYSLPLPETKAFCHLMYERFSFGEFFGKRMHGENSHEKNKFMETSSVLFSLANYSLRTIEQVFTQISLVFCTFRGKYLFPELLIFLFILKNDSNNDLYKKLLAKRCTEEEVLNFFYSLNKEQSFIKRNDGMVLESYIAYATTMYLHEDQYPYNKGFFKQKYIDLSNDDSADQLLKDRAKFALDVIHGPIRDNEKIMSIMLRKIELAERFVS